MTARTIKILAILAIPVVGLFALYGYANSTRNEGVQLEQTLSAQYTTNQNALSSHTTKIYEMVDVANLKSAKMDSILRGAVQGRYGQDGFKANGAFFASVQEAYPQIDLALYDRIVDAVAAGREEFKAKQDKLADQIRVYNTWRLSGIIRSAVVGNYFPSENLVAQIGQDVLTGADALKKMNAMVLSEEATAAFTSGVTKPMDLKNR